MNKPVILIGNGCRRNPALVAHLCSLGVPVLTTWMAANLVPEDSPVFCGRPGILGQRAANIIIQSCSDLYVFGARLDEQTVGFAGYDKFAPGAKVHVFDVDEVETKKYRHCCRVVYDLKKLPPDNEFLPRSGPSGWLAHCRALYARFRAELDGAPAPEGCVDPHAFVRQLSDMMTDGDVLALGSSGAAATVMCQAFRFKAGQDFTFVSTIGAMGADVPMAIGACIASGRRRTICVTGEGGIQQNAQELETIARLDLPIVFFVFNNDGYGSIRAMQDSRFSGRRVGCDAHSGFTTPPPKNLARCYGLGYYLLSAADEVHDLPDEKRPRIVEVLVHPTWAQYPRVVSSLVDGHWQPDALHDMTPKLPKDELEAIMNWDGDA